MKRRLLVSLYILISGHLWAQRPVSSGISPYSSATSFADHVSKKFSTDNERFSFVYDWICTNVTYDKDSALYFNWSASHDTKIDATLRRKKGVCENYASLLVDIATRMYIPAYVVHGFPTRISNNVDDSHAWVAVLLDNDWWLCDPTWDANGTDKRKYFLSTPQRFIETHIPFDPIWQLLEEPLYYKKTGKEKYNYKDSIAAFLKQDSLQQLMSSQQRIMKSDVKNNMVNNWGKLNNMHIAIIAGEKDEQQYNAAVGFYNKALNNYNAFINFRNNGFPSGISNEKLNQTLNAIAPLLDNARDKIKMLGSIKENFQYDAGDLIFQIDQLETKTTKQLNFLTAYLAADAKEKIKLLAGN
jgi:hypothetical protein